MDIVGAADAFCGGLVAAMEKGYSIRHSLVIALCASSLMTMVAINTAQLSLTNRKSPQKMPPKMPQRPNVGRRPDCQVFRALQSF